jgi:eukaryotic-like serine/threonine-protein kinase
VLNDLGELSEARDLIRSALASDENTYEPGHPAIAIKQSNLAMVLNDLGKLPEASKLLQTAYSTLLKKFGPKHPSTITVGNNYESVQKAIKSASPP